MRALHRDDGEQVHRAAFFGDFDHRRKSRKAATHHDDLWIYCHYRFPSGSVGGAGLVLSWSALSSAGTRACTKNARRLITPTPVITKKNNTQTTRNFCRARSPTVMPHCAQKSQIP